MTGRNFGFLLAWCFVFVGSMSWLLWLLAKATYQDRHRETHPPDSAQLRELAASLERLSRRVTDLATRSESAEKEHAGVT